MELTSWQKLDKYFNKKSMMEILDVDRKENNHSRFLGWLFEEKEAVKKLNNLLKERAIEQQANCFIDSNTINHVSVRLEESIQNGNIKGRADIVITFYPNKNDENPRYIVIENKVWSKEHNAGQGDKPQTEAYYRYYENVHGEGNTTYVFLTPLEPIVLNGLKQLQCGDCHYIQINYQDIARHVIDELIKDNKMKDNLRKVKDYLKALCINYSQEDILALDPALEVDLRKFWKDNYFFFENLNDWQNRNLDEQKELLEIWNKHADLIGLSIKSLAFMIFDDEKQTLLFKDLYEKLYPKTDDDATKTKKDRTKYYLGSVENWFAEKNKEQKLLKKTELIMNIVQRYVSQQSKSLSDIQNAFPPSLRKKTNCPIVIGGEGKARYSRVNDKNDIYVHQSLWDGTILMRHVIRHTQIIFPEIGPITEIPSFIL